MNQNEAGNKAKKLLVIGPHSGTKRPSEIKKEWLSEYQNRFLYGNDCETDRYTEKLYDFRKILTNHQIVFPYSQIYINICRSINNLNDVFPLYINKLPVYKIIENINLKLKKKLLKKYYFLFYKQIGKIDKKLILNGHSTIAGHQSLGKEKLNADIVLSNYLKYERKIIKFAPDEYLDFYENEIKKRMPFLKIEKNSIYISTYDAICYKFGWDGISKKTGRVPVIHQETNEKLYMDSNKINFKKLKILRNCLAKSLFATMKHFKLV